MILSENLKKRIAENDVVRLGVIGGGAGATEFVIRLLAAGGGRVPFDISIYEPRAKIGRGIAWENSTDSLIANMRLETLGPTYPQFELIRDILQEVQHPEAGQEYPSRNAMGVALDHRWTRACAKMPPHWRLRHRRTSVTDLAWNGVDAEIFCQDCQTPDRADIVILALGNISSKRDQHLEGVKVVNGWNEDAFAQIAKNEDVLIQGASLTAIDATIRLIEQGHEQNSGKIVWHSRSGELPFVRPQQAKLAPVFFTYPNLVHFIARLESRGQKLKISHIHHLFQMEMEAQRTQRSDFAANTDYAGLRAMMDNLLSPLEGLRFIQYGLDNATNLSLWFSVAKLLDEYTIPLLWNALADDEKLAFLQKHRRTFDRLWAPIPARNGQRIKDWLDNKTICLLRSKVSYVGDSATKKIHFDGVVEDAIGQMSKTDIAERYKAGFVVLIDAGGIKNDLPSLDSVLVHNLHKRGLLTPYQLNSTGGRYGPMLLGAQIDWYSGAAFDSAGCPHGWLFSLTGSLTAGVHRFTNSYLAVSSSGDRVATTVLGA